VARESNILIFKD